MSDNWTRIGLSQADGFTQDESGRSAVSYGIIACLAGMVVVVAIAFFSGTL